MGGVAKGNLMVRGQTVLSRTVGLCLQHVQPAQLVLVGDSSAYDEFPGARLTDCPSDVGPLGGLKALLTQAQGQGRNAIALAVDMPFVSGQLLARLLNAACVGALAPAEKGRWQPLFAQYVPAQVLPVIEDCLLAKHHSLQSVFKRLGKRAELLELSEAEQHCLRDWDTPADLLSHH